MRFWIHTLLCLIAAHCCCAQNPPQLPPWWNTVIIPGKDAKDFGAANIGQLKAFATAAFDYLEANFPGGAGSDVTATVKQWFQLTADGSFALDAAGKRIPKSANNFAAVNLGQLKNTVKPFYLRLMTRYLARDYPWQLAPPNNPSDFATANLGQLKRVFNFDILTDSDGDGMPDLYERVNGLGWNNPANGDDDSDGDGFSDKQEYLNNSDPLDPGNGAPLTVEKDGDNQTLAPDSFLDDPLVITLKSPLNHEGIQGIPIVFTASAGEMADWHPIPPIAKGRQHIEHTDYWGDVAAQYRAPKNLSGPVTITATYFHAGAEHTVTFSTVFVADNPQAPVAPTDLQVKSFGARSYALTWRDNSANEEGFIVEGQTAKDGPWQEIARVPANTTNYVIEYPNSGPYVFYRVIAFRNAP